jgi:hypothetical protein
MTKPTPNRKRRTLTMNEKRARELATRQIDRDAQTWERELVAIIKDIDAHERRTKRKKR